MKKKAIEKKTRGKTAPTRRRRSGPPRFLLERRNRAKTEGIRGKERLVPAKVDPDVFGEPRDFNRKAAPPVDARGKKLGLTARRQYIKQKKKMKNRFEKRFILIWCDRFIQKNHIKLSTFALANQLYEKLWFVETSLYPGGKVQFTSTSCSTHMMLGHTDFLFVFIDYSRYQT